MAFVVASSSRVGISARRNSPLIPVSWRVALKALTGGLWVAVGRRRCRDAVCCSAPDGCSPSRPAPAPPSSRSPRSRSRRGGAGLDGAGHHLDDRQVGRECVGGDRGPLRLRSATARQDGAGRLDRSRAAHRRHRAASPRHPQHRLDRPCPKAVAATDIALPLRRPQTEASPVPLPPTKPKLASLGPTNLGVKPPASEPHPPRTAVYDISAQLVYLPNGERLEAHSGPRRAYGQSDQLAHQDARRPPPNSYRLTLREAPVPRRAGDPHDA